MIKQIFLWLWVGGGCLACAQEIAPEVDMAASNPKILDSVSTQNYQTKQKLVVAGNFQNAVHQTSGTAKIYLDSIQHKYSLVFENFKTEAGPDLRIYLAEDRAISNFIQVSDKVQQGNVQYDLPNTTDFSKQTHVLIWCKSYSVLFGLAVLK